MIEISEAPLAGLFGSESAYQVLMYMENYENGYASQIAKAYGTSLNQIQNQLNKFEQLGLLVSRKVGTARVFYFTRSPVTDSLRVFLKSMLEQLPKSIVQKFYRDRRCSRRPGKRNQ